MSKKDSIKKDSIKEELETAANEETTADEGETKVPVQEDQVQESTNSTEDPLARLERELEEANRIKDELYNKMLRMQADFENFRRRSRQEYEQVCLYGGEEILKKILPVLDSLERAVNSFNTQNPEQSSWQEGVQLTLRQFQNILSAEGLEAIPALDQPFNPQVHEAVLQEESAAVSEPTVVQELQKGYKYKNRLLRPALVKVAVPGKT